MGSSKHFNACLAQVSEDVILLDVAGGDFEKDRAAWVVTKGEQHPSLILGDTRIGVCGVPVSINEKEKS